MYIHREWDKTRDFVSKYFLFVLMGDAFIIKLYYIDIYNMFMCIQGERDVNQGKLIYWNIGK